MAYEELNLTLDGLSMDSIYDNFLLQVAGGKLQLGNDVDMKQAVANAKEREKRKRQAIPTYKALIDYEIIVSRNTLEECLWQDFRYRTDGNYFNPLNPVDWLNRLGARQMASKFPVSATGWVKKEKAVEMLQTPTIHSGLLLK